MVAVTGGTGHLGTVLIRELASKGEQVRYITRSGAARGLEGTHAEPFDTDLFNPARLTEAFAGCSTVYHSAARISLLPGDEYELHRVNVEGTRNVFRAAREAGVRRFVHVGSIEAFPLKTGPYPITEKSGIDPDNTVMEYGRSKAEAILEVLGADPGGMECVVCCPTGFVGPPDFRLSAAGQFILDYLNGHLPASVDGGFDFVDVRDVADGVIRAAESGRPGEMYLLSGHYATVPRLMEILESASGIPKPFLRFPIPLILPFMPFVETYYRITGKSPRFTSNSLRLLALGVTVDSSKARNELGYIARPLEETFSDTIQWFAANRAVTPAPADGTIG